MKQHVKNVVLVHGAFADGSGWKKVADTLKADGYKVSVAQPPETFVRRRPKIHKGGDRRDGRSGGSGRP